MSFREDDSNALGLPLRLKRAERERMQPKRTFWQRLWAWICGLSTESEPERPNAKVIDHCSVCGTAYSTRPIGSFVPEDGKCYVHSTGKERGEDRYKRGADVAHISVARDRKLRGK